MALDPFKHQHTRPSHDSYSDHPLSNHSTSNHSFNNDHVSYPTQHRQQRNAANEEEAPLGYWMGLEAWRKTKGIASIDLRRPGLPGGHPGDSLLRSSYGLDAPTHPGAPTAGKRNPFMTSQRPPRSMYGNGYSADDSSLLGGAFSGARCKVLRCIEWNGPNGGVKWQPPPGHARSVQFADQKAQPNANLTARDVQDALHDVGDRLSASLRPRRDAPLFNFGIGASLGLSQGGVQPICRLKVKDFLSVKFLPRPILKLHKRFPLGQTGLALRVVYDCPLEELENFTKPPARLLVRLDNKAGSGIHIGTSGVEFDERVVALGRNAEARFGATVGFPRQIPVMEGEQLFNWDIHRLGLKTRW